ncbi:hypothetical protein MN116_000354, partial [Schistosoma mekongi]
MCLPILTKIRRMMKKKKVKLFRKKVEYGIQENIKAEYITHVADENVINVDYAEDGRRDGDEEREEAAEGADKLCEEVKIGSEGRDSYVVVCDDDDDDDSAINLIEDSNQCNSIIDVNSDNNDNASSNISNNNDNNRNNNYNKSNNKNGNSVYGSHRNGSSVSGSHNHIREEAAEGADKLCEEVKIGSEGRDSYVVVCDDDDDDDSAINLIEDSNQCNSIIDVNSDNNDNASSNISNNNDNNRNNNYNKSNNKNGNSVYGSHR